MKKCPKCKKTYDDSWSVCMNDESKLVDNESSEIFVAEAQSADSHSNAGKAAYIPYIKQFFALGACLLGMYLMQFGIRRKYDETQSVIQTILSYNGIMFILLACATGATAYIIWKYRKTFK